MVASAATHRRTPITVAEIGAPPDLPNSAGHCQCSAKMALPMDVRVHLLYAESLLMPPHRLGKWMFALLASAWNSLGQTPPFGKRMPAKRDRFRPVSLAGA
jgi:hypothetical protein